MSAIEERLTPKEVLDLTDRVYGQRLYDIAIAICGIGDMTDHIRKQNATIEDHGLEAPEFSGAYRSWGLINCLGEHLLREVLSMRSLMKGDGMFKQDF